MYEDEEISGLVRQHVDKKTGELHLDKDKATLLIRWLMSVENTLREQNKLVVNLKGILETEK